MPNRILLTLAVATLSSCATQTSVPFSPSDACSVSATTYDSREVQCRFPKTQFGHAFRFKANFSGGHDDTVARIDAFIDDAPLDCAANSKTYLSAEDGEVSLWCNFSVADQAQGISILKVAIRWSHAEYVNYEIQAQ